MKKVEYVVSSFVDYTGATRGFVMAAVSMYGEKDICIEEDYETVDASGKLLSLGVSVCRPGDDFDADLGKRIAEGKATKYRTHALYAVDAGLINEVMVKALLQQEVEYFKVNPGRYLAGYNKDAVKYRESERIESYIESLEGEAKTAFEYLLGASNDEVENIAEAVAYTER